MSKLDSSQYACTRFIELRTAALVFQLWVSKGAGSMGSLLDQVQFQCNLVWAGTYQYYYSYFRILCLACYYKMIFS